VGKKLWPAGRAVTSGTSPTRLVIMHPLPHVIHDLDPFAALGI
jgi:hypothetical protein